MIKCFNCDCEITEGEEHINLNNHMVCEDCSPIIALASLKDMGVSEGTINELEKC